MSVTRRKTFKWGGLGAGLLCLVIAAAFVFGKYEFSLTETQIRDRVAEKLPFTKNNATINDVVIDLSQSDVHIVASGTATKVGRTYEFVIDATGVPVYRMLGGEFFFKASEVKIENVKQIDGPTVEEDVSKAASFVKKLLPQRTQVIDEVAYAANQLAPEIQSWIIDRAGAAATAALEHRPVYRLPGDIKGIAAKAVLDDVWIADKELHVKLSLYRLTTWVLFLGLLCVACLGAVTASIYAPGAFIFFGLLSS